MKQESSQRCVIHIGSRNNQSQKSAIVHETKNQLKDELSITVYLAQSSRY